MALGIGFFTTGIFMIRAIKLHFVEFYEKVNCALWTATILLAVPMFLRAINWFGQNQFPAYESFYYANIAYSNAIYCIVTTIFPVAAQMASLIFGMLNNRKNPEDNRRSQPTPGYSRVSGSGEQMLDSDQESNPVSSDQSSSQDSASNMS